jgi:phytanoyl-CoA hydroxylase
MNAPLAMLATNPHLAPVQVAAFWRDGFVPLGRILDEPLLSTLRAEYDRCFSVERGNALRTNDAPEQTVWQILGLNERSLAFRQFLYHPAVLEPLKQVLGPNLQLFHDQALWKPPRSGGAVAWHQDNGYWQFQQPLLASLWLTLDDVVTASGAMQFIPGSHHTPASHQTTGTLMEVSGIDPAAVVSVELPAGGALLHHCQTLHYTAPNTTDRNRRAFAIHVMVPGITSTNPHHGPLAVGWQRPLLCRG